MKRCTLCGRKISNTRYTYGLGCLKKMCNSVNVHNVKNLKGESLLNRKILKLCNKKTLPLTQRQLLTDRYLTLNLLMKYLLIVTIIIEVYYNLILTLLIELQL